MRVLVVDDDKNIRGLLKRALESEHFAVDTAPDGEQGVYLACTNDYDILVVDNRMPKKDGRTVCREVRTSGKHMPILMLSVHVDATEKADLLNAGADDYMGKPFSFGELLARMRALLRRPPVVQHEELTIGSVSLNTRSNRVTRNGEEVRLTRKEYMLLEYLMRNPGTVLSRGMIMEHVWDMSADPFSNTIESHILSLRRKLEAPRGPKLIKTVSGRGYLMDNPKDFKKK